MVKASSVVVEIDNEHCRNLYFAPLDRVLRGTFDVQRVARHNPNALALLHQYPQAVPGQRIKLDAATGEGELIEPLHDPQHKATVAQLAQRGLSLPPERETFQSVDVPSWLLAMRSACKCGAARLIEGELPEGSIPGARESFITQPSTDPMALLTAAFERQATALETLIRKLGS